MTAFVERRRLGFTQRQLFDLVADVERYPEFLPWILATRILCRTRNMVEMEMLVGYKFLRQRFRSRGVLDPPHRIDITSEDAPFRHLRQHWLFEPGASDGTTVEFRAEFDFRSRIWQVLLTQYFHDGMRRMVGAFERRAQQIYGNSGIADLSALTQHGCAPPRGRRSRSGI